VISAFTSSVKGRTLAALTAALFLLAMVGQGFAITPVENSAERCRMHTMEGMQHLPGPPEHKCKHEMPKMPCCPMPLSQNTAPAECMTRGECCQISEDRSRSSRKDALANRADQSDEQPATKASTAAQIDSRSKNPTWVEVRLRHTRPVFDLKTDFRT
jgi:hypothetical protein